LTITYFPLINKALQQEAMDKGNKTNNSRNSTGPSNNNIIISQLCSGAIAGVFADVLTHPFSTIKTRLQVQGATSAVSNGATEIYSGPISALISICRKEGFRSLYKGVGVVVVAAAPSQALYFGGYETVKRLAGDHPMSIFAAGCAAQLCGSLAWVPMDVIKERLQIEGQVSTTENFGGSYSAFKNILKNEGVKGLYRAYWMHQLTWAPFNGLYFTIYEGFKKYLLKNPLSLTGAKNAASSSSSGGAGGGALPGLDKFVCAVAAGAIASVSTSPIDLVKTRLQVQASNPDIFDYRGPIDATMKIVKREGFLALFDGVAARILWLTPRLSASVTVYELVNIKIKSYLDER
jgi:solute carrier family 25 (mitochondrial citrate transporter), member 1